MYGYMVQWYHVRFACERPRVRSPIYPDFFLITINKYRVHFNEHPTLYNDIINEFESWYGKINENTSINVIKENTIEKSIKEMSEKNDIKISKDYRKVVKKFWYKGLALEERCFIRFICETGWTNNHKK